MTKFWFALRGASWPSIQRVAQRWRDCTAQSPGGTRCSHRSDRAVQADQLVTRNVKDFEAFGVPLLNPWDAA